MKNKGMLDDYVGMMVHLELTTIVASVESTDYFYGELFQADKFGEHGYMLKLAEVWMEVSFLTASARVMLDIDDDGLVYNVTIQVTVSNDYS